MQTGFTIRRANENDSQSAYSLIVALGYLTLTSERFTEIFNTVITHPETIVLLAENEIAQAIGLLTISHRPQLRLGGTIVCIDELIVSDQARGRGVGQALLQAAKRFAVDLKAERIELHTRRTRESYKRQFYVKNGFTEANSALLRIEKADFNR